MLERWFHGVQVLLQQPVELRDGAPSRDRSCDLSQDFQCSAGFQAEVVSDTHQRIHARTRICVVDGGAEVLRAGLWVEVKRRR